tara:strand:- start:246 stop:509 length:264 start_codon:yes stop_codon:yes gene_type:complete
MVALLLSSLFLKGISNMANPTYKLPVLEDFFNATFGVDRSQSIRDNVCVSPSCDNSATSFRDELSRKEYTISGLCQSCQDSVFGGKE